MVVINILVRGLFVKRSKGDTCYTLRNMSAVPASQPISAKPSTDSRADAIAKLKQQRAKLTEDIRAFIRLRVDRNELWKSSILPWQRVDLIIDYAYELDGAEAALKAALQEPELADKDIRFVRLLTMQWSDIATRLEKFESSVIPPAPAGEPVALPKLSGKIPQAKVVARPRPPVPPFTKNTLSKLAEVNSKSAAKKILPITSLPKSTLPLEELEKRLSQGLNSVWRNDSWWQAQVPLEKRWSVLVDVILDANPEHDEALDAALTDIGRAKVQSICQTLRQDLRDLYTHPKFADLSERVDAQTHQVKQAEPTDWVAEFVPEAELETLFTELEALLDDEQKITTNEPRAKELFTKIQKTLSDSREQLDDEYEFLGLTPLERQLVLFKISDYRRRYRSRMRHLRQNLRELHGNAAEVFFPEIHDQVTEADKGDAPDTLASVAQPVVHKTTGTEPKKKTVGDTLERVLDYVAGGWGEVETKQKHEDKKLEVMANEKAQDDDGVELPPVPAEPEPIVFVPEDSSVRLAGQSIPQVLEQAIKSHPERYGADMASSDLEQHLYCRTMALRLSAALGGAQYVFTPQAVGMVQVFPEFQDSGDWLATLAISGRRSTLETLLKDGYLQQK
jgi:hypothetical protein